MKNTRTWIILSIAILSGLLAVLLAGRWLDRQSHNDITQVVVAALKSVWVRDWHQKC